MSCSSDPQIFHLWSASLLPEPHVRETSCYILCTYVTYRSYAYMELKVIVQVVALI